MTVRYEYKSSCCSHKYIEQRGSEEPQWITKCNGCGNGEYELVEETILADSIQLNPGPEPETPAE
jgi:hypothetical protein